MSEKKKFYKASRKIGQDFNLIQGPGGNTSMKVNGNILIKKSGSFLNNKKTEDSFVIENVNNLISFYRKARNNEKYNNYLSIETPLHIEFIEKYVFHYHSILSIIISSKYKISKIIEICNILNIEWVPYHRPGKELANAIKKIKTKNSNKIFFLQNHGILIASNDLDFIIKNIYKLEREFKKLLSISVYRKFKPLKIKKIRSGLYKCKLHENLRNINLKNFNNIFLFPDHAVFSNVQFQKFSQIKELQNNVVYFDENFLYFKNKMDASQLFILSTVLIVLSYCLKVYNFIDLDSGKSLYNSPDEIIRKSKLI